MSGEHLRIFCPFIPKSTLSIANLGQSCVRYAIAFGFLEPILPAKIIDPGISFATAGVCYKQLRVHEQSYLSRLESDGKFQL